MSHGSFPVLIDGHPSIDFSHDGKGRREQKFDDPYFLSAGECGVEHISFQQCHRISNTTHEDPPELFSPPELSFTRQWRA